MIITKYQRRKFLSYTEGVFEQGVRMRYIRAHHRDERPFTRDFMSANLRPQTCLRGMKASEFRVSHYDSEFRLYRMAHKKRLQKKIVQHFLRATSFVLNPRTRNKRKDS